MVEEVFCQDSTDLQVDDLLFLRKYLALYLLERCQLCQGIFVYVCVNFGFNKLLIEIKLLDVQIVLIRKIS